MLRLTLALLAAFAPLSLRALSYLDTYSLNGQANAVVMKGNTAYVGGSFTEVNRFVKNTAIIDAAGTVNFNSPEFSAIPYGVIDDGAGGFIAWGDFQFVNGQYRPRLVRINSDGSLDSWSPNPNSTVNAVTRTATHLYVGGSFSSIGGQARYYVAAFDLPSYTLSAWDPQANSTVNNLFPAPASRILVSGSFNTIGNQPRTYLAELADASSSTGWATTWRPNPNNQVNEVVFVPGSVFVRGNFNSVGGQSRNYLAQLDYSGSTGWATTFSPAPNSNVNGMVYEAGLLYVYGNFTSIGGQSRYNIAALDAGGSTGWASTWNPNPNSSVLGMVNTGGKFLVWGYFNTIGNKSRYPLAEIDASGSTGWATNWHPNLGSNVHDLKVESGVVHVTGTFSNVGPQSRVGFARIDYSGSTGWATSWNPGFTPYNWPYKFALSGGSILALGGGNPMGPFRVADRSRLAAFNAQTGALLPWNPGADSTVEDMALSPSGNIVVAGQFNNAASQPRNYLAEIDADTGAATAWDPQANSTVYHVETMGNTVYASGYFGGIGPASVQYLAAIDASGSTGWAYADFLPNPNARVFDLARDGNILYAAGEFTSIGGASRNYVAALDPVTGADLGVNYASPNSTVLTLLQEPGRLLIGGQFSDVGGAPKGYLAALNPATGALLAFTGAADSTVNHIARSGDGLLIGGGFSLFNGMNRAGLVKTDMNGALQSPVFNGNTTVYQTANYFDTLWVAGSFSTFGSEPHYNLVAAQDPLLPNSTATLTATPTYTATPTATPTASPSMTPTMTPTATPTASQTHTPTVTPTFTNTVTFTHSPTPQFTFTATFPMSGIEKPVFGPVPAKKGQPLCLYLNAEPSSSIWTLFNTLGEKVADADFRHEHKQCLTTTRFAPGIYMVKVQVAYRDGRTAVQWQRIVIVE